jgi:hypothetical protein
MTFRHALLAFAVLVAGCASIPPAAPPSAAPAAAQPGSPLGSPFADRPAPGDLGLPLLIDRTDMRIGTTVQFRHVPTPSELHDLTLLPGISRVVLTFDTWPHEYAPIKVLDEAPEGVEVVAVLRGWPPGRAQVDAWNYLRVPLRAIVLVPGPPESVDQVQALNEMRGLERVIAQMDEPSRRGFERLQRPLSFRKVID